MAVIVLHAPLVTDARWQLPLLEALPYAKRLEVERRAGDACRASLAGIALALLGAERLRTGTVSVRQLVFPPGGKPVLAGGPHFSIAHTAGHAACAISADIDPGFDIERVNDADAAELAQLRRWTAIEATLKAAGKGVRHAGGVRLAGDSRSSEFLGAHYELQFVTLVPETVCCLASLQQRGVLVEAMDLDSPGVSAILQRCLGRGAQLE